MMKKWIIFNKVVCKHIKWGWYHPPTLIHNPHLNLVILYLTPYTLIWNIFGTANGFEIVFEPIWMYNFPKVYDFQQSCVQKHRVGWPHPPTLIHNPYLHLFILHWTHYTLIWNIIGTSNGFRVRFGPIVMYNFPKVYDFQQSYA